MGGASESEAGCFFGHFGLAAIASFHAFSSQMPATLAPLGGCGSG